MFAIRPEARGDISPRDGASASDGVVWSTPQAGSYISTPVVYRDYTYLGNANGVVRCLNAKTGKKMFEERLSPDATIVTVMCDTGMKYLKTYGNDTDQARLGHPS